MNLDTTKKKMREQAFKKIRAIIEDEFNAIVLSEEARVDFFCEHQFQVVDFEILLQDEFGGKIELDQNPTIKEVLDLVCHY